MRSLAGTAVARNSLQPTTVDRRLIHEDARRIPQLLVSVRSADEAEKAIAGGAEILDIKDPSRGSLGMGRLSDISAIAELNPIANGRIPLSVALGELCDWSGADAIPDLPEGIRFAKMGLSHTSHDPEWISQWIRVRHLFRQQSGHRLSWVAVAYADADIANAPRIEQVLEAAIRTECEGLLIDTWQKDGQQLIDHVDAARLEEIQIRCHRSGLFLALAGCLNVGSLPKLQTVAADVIAIRSAACRKSDRNSELDSTQVAVFREKLHQVFSQTTANRSC